MTNRIPQTVFNELGKGKLEKSRWSRESPGENVENTLYLVAWDFAEKCNGSDCALYDICVYKDNWKLKAKNQHKSGATDKCMMQQRYIRNVISAFMSVANKSQKEIDIGEDNVIKLGYELIPLYAQLFKFKCFEYTNKDVVYMTEKGTPKVHPVYKEIRETIKTIAGVWKDVVPRKDAKKADPKGVGDTAFIDAVYGGGEEAESKNGSGIDFEEVEEETDETGSGIDFDKHSDVPDKVQKRQKSRKSRRKKKTSGKKTRASKNVVKYDSRAKRSADDGENGSEENS